MSTDQKKNCDGCAGDDRGSAEAACTPRCHLFVRFSLFSLSLFSPPYLYLPLLSLALLSLLTTLPAVDVAFESVPHTRAKSRSNSSSQSQRGKKEIRINRFCKKRIEGGREGGEGGEGPHNTHHTHRHRRGCRA